MPATVYLVTGGARSGKSSYAQSLCEGICDEPIYLATSKAWDHDFARRVKRHQEERSEMWTTIEEPLKPSQHKDAFSGKAVLVDCLTLWLTNYMIQEGVFTEPKCEKSDDDEDISEASERALAKVQDEFDAMVTQWNATFIFVTNEIGSGLHGESNASRKFVDAHGWFNQHVAKTATMVVHMVAGVPNVIKGPPAKGRRPRKIPNTEKRLERQVLDEFLSARTLTMDSKGYFMMKLDHDKEVIRATYHSCIVNDKGEVCDAKGVKIKCCDGSNRPEPMETFEGRTAKELTVKIFEQWKYAEELITVGHAAYIGREAQRAEQCLFDGTSFQQD